jgi:hypothetical protein
MKNYGHNNDISNNNLNFFSNDVNLLMLFLEMLSNWERLEYLPLENAKKTKKMNDNNGLTFI